MDRVVIAEGGYGCITFENENKTAVFFQITEPGTKKNLYSI